MILRCGPSGMCTMTWKFCLVGFIAFMIFALPLYSGVRALLIVVTQIRGHIASSFPPSPLRFVPGTYYREETSTLSSLVDSRRMPLLIYQVQKVPVLIVHITGTRARTSLFFCVSCLHHEHHLFLLLVRG